MAQLRPHLKQSDFLPLVRRMESEGYRIAYIEQNGMVVAVAGYRISTNFHLGKHLYVNDLVTSSSLRSMGYGEELIDWLRLEAKSAGCRFLDLDSGIQRDRAHKFYFKHGFTIASFHFSDSLSNS
jgi:ribosomal protein S18 acetylase RimI-like enzyme